MIAHRLMTFGTLELVDATRSTSGHPRRQLALLALLAASGARGISRDRLVALLWPERTAAAGRHSLEQLVYTVRRALGDALVGVNPLRLDSAVVASDIAEFVDALERGALEDAVHLYRGPFLDGFHLDGDGDFGRWVEVERARQARRYHAALERLARGADVAGDYAAAIGWWRTLAEACPFGSAAALGLMRALVASGDRGAALHHARQHQAFVRRELDSEPDPSVLAFVRSLRGPAGGARSASRSVPAAT